ncbi:MAG: hypothetical protein KAU28_07240 [Phycisphaerae bacterium]|nr:hypothetical protein [Phycisphaerae bacterium]
MRPEITKFLITVTVIVASTVLGYAARRLRLLPERIAERLMTAVVVFGYSSVSFLTIWNLEISAADAWLPVLGGAHVLIMAAAGLGLARLLTRDRGEVGLFSMAWGVGNTGFTMGGFIIYLLYNERGLGLVGIYALWWTPALVFVLYPIARYFGPGRPTGALGPAMLRSIFDWRSIGLPAALAGVGLSLSGTPRPDVISDLRIVDILVFLVTTMAYFAIGLRLSVYHAWAIKKLILGLAVVRFGLGLLLGVLMVALTRLTAWPLTGTGRNVMIIESFVPVAVTVVAVANMFGLKPREASVLFVINTLMYLLLVLPLVLWVFG